MSVALVHLVLLSVWGGIVVTEVVVELLPRWRPELRRAAATFHYFIDLAVELPVLIGVLVSGGLMVARRPMDTQLALKVTCGLTAVVANLFCVAMVVRRQRGGDESLVRRTRLVFLSAAIGMPAAAVALYLGATRAGWIG